MKYVKWLMVIFVWSCIISCMDDHVNTQGIDDSNAVTIEIDPEDMNADSWLDTNDIEFIFLPLDEQYPYGNIAKAIFRDQKIFIKPHMIDKIYIYTETGEPYGIIHQYGAGPGEYLNLADFDVNSSKDEIIVSDAANKKFLTYSYSGNFISEKQMDFSIKMIKSYPTNKGIYYITDLRYSDILPGQSENYNINIFNEDWDYVNGYFPFSKFRGGMFGNPYLLFNKSETPVGYYKPFTDSVFHFDDREMVLAYYLDFAKPVLSYDEFEKSNYGANVRDRVFNITYDESSSYLLVSYMYNDYIYKFIYDKVRKTIKYFTSYQSDGSCLQNVFSHMLGLHGSKLVLQIDALDVPCILEIFQNHLTDGQLAALNQVQEIDNNFLMLIQL